MSCVSNTSCLGGSLFCSGLLVDLNRAGDSFYQGGEFFAEIQRGIRRLRTAGTTPYPRRWAKRKDNLRFSFLFELLPFPCFLIWRRLPTCDRSEKEYGRGFFLCCGRTTFGVRPLEQPVRSVRYITATQVGYFQQARHKVNCPKGKRGSPGG